jgi:hypothetical protein
MLRTALLSLSAALVVACTGAATSPSPLPSGSPMASAPGTPSPSPTMTTAPSPTLDTSLFHELPEIIAGLPLGGGTPTAEIAPESVRGLVPDPAVAHSFELGHCGLLGPIDFDGTLWVAQGGHNGVGGPLTDDQVGELINPTQVRLFLLDDRTALLVTPLNAFVLLSRHEGSREYALCD